MPGRTFCGWFVIICMVSTLVDRVLTGLAPFATLGMVLWGYLTLLVEFIIDTGMSLGFEDKATPIALYGPVANRKKANDDITAEKKMTNGAYPQVVFIAEGEVVVARLQSGSGAPIPAGTCICLGAVTSCTSVWLKWRPVWRYRSPMSDAKKPAITTRRSATGNERRCTKAARRSSATTHSSHDWRRAGAPSLLSTRYFFFARFSLRMREASRASMTIFSPSSSIHCRMCGLRLRKLSRASCPASSSHVAYTRALALAASAASSAGLHPPPLTLSGGEACPTKQVALWRSGRLTDTVVTVEGATFAAHKLVLASACSYFERHYDHEHMRDADYPKLIEHVTAAVFLDNR